MEAIQLEDFSKYVFGMSLPDLKRCDETTERTVREQLQGNKGCWVEAGGTTGEETISYWFDLPIDIAEFEEKLGVGAESGGLPHYRKVVAFADEVHEHTSVYQLNELDFMYRQLSSDMQEEYVSLLTI